MVVERLKTAPENDAPSNPDSPMKASWFLGRSGAVLGLRRDLKGIVAITGKYREGVCDGEESEDSNPTVPTPPLSCWAWGAGNKII